MSKSGNYKGRGSFNRPKDTHRTNKYIRAKEVRLVGEDGEQFGILKIEDALAKAQDAGLDLVEVAPNGKPPVCKLLDYGKFKYKEQKKQAEARKKRNEISIKELRIRYRTDKGDLDTKLKKARQFLEEGDKVKFSMRFRGREIAHMDLGFAKFNEIKEELKDISIIDEQSPPRGRQIFIVFAPLKAA